MDNKEIEFSRLAKVLARAGVASRRNSEKLIFDGSISVNDVTVYDPSTKVSPADLIRVNGRRVKSPDSIRIWRFHKPVGLVTSESDQKSRQTVFDVLPEKLPRVISIGRLDIMSEGLLLLTNDGHLKRKLELPASGIKRKYRVRARGVYREERLKSLRKGIIVDGDRFRPMEITLDKQQGANSWYTVSLQEGKNREIRRAFKKIDLEVNRLIRVGFGPFQLGSLLRSEVKEVPTSQIKEILRLLS